MSTARPFLIEDMTALLLACSAEPTRLRKADRDFYARDRTRIAGAMRPLEGDLLALADFGLDVRLDHAWSMLSRLGFARIESDLSGAPVYTGTREGREWMELGDVMLHRVILDSLRPLMEDEVERIHGRSRKMAHGAIRAPRLGLFPFQRFGGYLGGAINAECERAAAEAFRWLVDKPPTPLDTLLEHAVAAHNPLADPQLQRRILLGYGVARDVSGLWLRILSDMILQYLVPLGALAVAWDDEGYPLIELTAAGRYLFGLDSDLPDPLAGLPDSVRIQADFHIVFLRPAPAAERALGRFSERLGTDVGTLFRITPESVRIAAAAGLTERTVLEALEATCIGGLPRNVKREIQGWMSSSRRLTARMALVIDCGDEETALRVAAEGGAKLRMIGSTVVEAPEGKLPAALLRKLAAAGLFVEEGVYEPWD